MNSTTKQLLIIILFISIVSLCFANGEEDEKMGGSIIVGATTMNGQNFQQIGLRADLPFWKIGFGLDIQLYIDDQGNVRKEDWDEFQDYLDKIYYIRWAHKGDPFYLKVGGLENSTLGYGIAVDNYSNMIQYPTYKRIGMESSFQFDKIGGELFINNFKEFLQDNPGMVLGLRGTYQTMGKLKIGGFLASDFNEYNGLFDTDNDGYPDAIDKYPNDKDLVVEREKWEQDLAGYPNADITLQTLFDAGIVDSTKREGLPQYADSSSTVTIMGMDAGYALLETDLLKLDVYTQIAKIINYGSGFSFPGVRFKIGPVTATAEYRHANEKFLFGYFNQTYEIERARTFGSHIIKKSQFLDTIEAMNGYYAGLSFDLFKLVVLSVNYQDLRGDSLCAKSLRGSVSIKENLIPKVSTAKVYYSQDNVNDLSEYKTPSTIMGYVIGFNISDGVSINFDHRYTFEDRNGDGKIQGKDETIKSVSIFTAIKF